MGYLGLIPERIPIPVPDRFKGTPMATGYYTPYDRNQAFYGRADWLKVFAWIPRRCELSNKLIWLEHLYKGTAMWTGPGEPVYETRWHGHDEHLFWLLTK